MGLAESKHEKAVSKEPSLLRKLSYLNVASLRFAYRKIKQGHFSTSNYLDKATFLQLLNYPSDVSKTVLDVFDEDDDGIINWKQCLGGLTLFASGKNSERIDLLFQLYQLCGRAIQKEELSGVLTTVLLAAQRIYLRSTKNGYQGAVYYMNTGSVVTEIIDSIYSNKNEEICLPEFLIWAESNKQLLDTVCRIDCSKSPPKDTNDDDTDSLANQKICYVWSQITQENEAKKPSSRSKQASCLLNGCIYIYGGRDGSMGMKDLWKYDIVKNKWSSIQFKGERPYYLEEHTMVAYKGKIYLFGGEFGSTYSDEAPLWIFCTSSETWEKHHIDSEVLSPDSRRGHTAVVSSNAMHIYGGYIDLKGSNSELWCFDFETEAWHLAYSTSLQNEGPGARHWHSAVVHDNSMWVYGGMQDLAPKDDLWQWSFITRNWSRVKTKPGPGSLFGHTATKVADGMLLYGGEIEGVLRNELWKYHFGSQVWQKILSPSIIAPPRIWHSMCLVTPLNLAASQADRTQSVPYLRDSHDQPDANHDTPQRPYSSPPVISDNTGPVFKNRVSPLPSPMKDYYESNLQEHVKSNQVVPVNKKSNQPQILSPSGNIMRNIAFKSALPKRQLFKETEDTKKLLHYGQSDSTDSMNMLSFDNITYKGSQDSLLGSREKVRPNNCDKNLSNLKSKYKLKASILPDKSVLYRLTRSREKLSKSSSIETLDLKNERNVSRNPGSMVQQTHDLQRKCISIGDLTQGCTTDDYVPGLVRSGSLESLTSSPRGEITSFTQLDQIISQSDEMESKQSSGVNIHILNNHRSETYQEKYEDINLVDIEDYDYDAINQDDTSTTQHNILNNWMMKGSKEEEELLSPSLPYLIGNQHSIPKTDTTVLQYGYSQTESNQVWSDTINTVQQNGICKTEQSSIEKYRRSARKVEVKFPADSPTSNNNNFESSSHESKPQTDITKVHEVSANNAKYMADPTSIDKYRCQQQATKGQGRGHARSHTHQGTVIKKDVVNTRNVPKDLFCSQGKKKHAIANTSLLVIGGRESKSKNITINPITIWKCELIPGCHRTPQQIRRLHKELNPS